MGSRFLSLKICKWGGALFIIGSTPCEGCCVFRAFIIGSFIHLYLQATYAACLEYIKVQGFEHRKLLLTAPVQYQGEEFNCTESACFHAKTQAKLRLLEKYFVVKDGSITSVNTVSFSSILSSQLREEARGFITRLTFDHVPSRSLHNRDNSTEAAIQRRP